MPSLSFLYLPVHEDESPDGLLLQQLRSPVDVSRFLFSSLQTLHIDLLMTRALLVIHAR